MNIYLHLLRSLSSHLHIKRAIAFLYLWKMKCDRPYFM
ncbi:hypothetical protein B6N60_04564 [Richelia sinica FACHB-800]|uniref:Uncharacterized protein n=1 Tax=Richelia sinica FACHB-800 TaxID=1357546 RepID=A0A975Y718_9NOST|nr:hypothetical protein B6N60_04564 [Richelia sinica FACHB-800]